MEGSARRRTRHRRWRRHASSVVETRQRILRTSLELFATRGFDGTDIVDIEEAVGLTPGSGGFYRHFKNKEAVLHAVIEAELDARPGVPPGPRSVAAHARSPISKSAIASPACSTCSGRCDS